ncbi:MAG: tRNA (uridine(34)/cytosine(34)/5-carboxymethylaminomethyluridine(34)-2'-O)-methyltransferase TrmL [Clostridiaceae bacterium]|nr:tRNA (uridine(34)/cytosine(34)/5-carboxymethylaminomethyluridine(34)-2'-O)-methyltransferase TrmL [Clostridiaceae bacterium]
MALNIVLHEPEIPQNTGNIARSCAATGAALHLIGPLGFSIEDRYLKRAGLDYWDKLDLHYYSSLDDFFSKHHGKPIFFSSTKASKTYDEVQYTRDCFIMFGKETRGLPETLLRERYGQCIRIPMRENIRSLNLSNAVAIVMYEALRQMGFPGLLKHGQLTGNGPADESLLYSGNHKREDGNG